MEIRCLKKKVNFPFHHFATSLIIWSLNLQSQAHFSSLTPLVTTAMIIMMMVCCGFQWRSSCFVQWRARLPLMRKRTSGPEINRGRWMRWRGSWRGCPAVGKGNTCLQCITSTFWSRVPAYSKLDTLFDIILWWDTIGCLYDRIGRTMECNVILTVHFEYIVHLKHMEKLKYATFFKKH